MIRGLRTWLWLGALFALCQWLAPAGMAPMTAAQASVPGVTCEATIGGINFGIVDPSWWGSGWFSGNVNLKTTGFLTYFCRNTNSSQKNVDVCISLGNPGFAAQRAIVGPGGDTLSYDLYADAGNTSQWGSTAPSTWGAPYSATVTVPAGGTSTPTTVPIYATLASNQTLVTGSGAYSVTYGPNDVAIDTGPSGCASASGGGTINGFQVTATVSHTCQVYTNTLDFGTAPTGDPSNLAASAALNISCAGFTGYRVGLDAGQNWDGSSRRMRGGPTHGDYIPYELYRQNCSTPWGNTDRVDTQTGTQASQTFTICGKVASNQGNAQAGDYYDVVTVYVYY